MTDSMRNADPPVIGAALHLSTLPMFTEWLIEKQRDLELQCFGSPSELGGDWLSTVHQAKKLLRGFTGRLGIHGPFYGFSIDCSDPDIQTIISKRMIQALDICDALSADQIVIHSPLSLWNHNNFSNRPGSFERLIESVHACLDSAVRRAADQGVEFVLENVEDINPADRERIASSFNSNALKLSLDTGHAHCAYVCTGAPPVDYFVRAAGNQLHHVHLQDTDGYADRHWAISEGSVSWHAVFRELGTLRSQPRLLLELQNPHGIPSSMAYLESKGLGQ